MSLDEESICGFVKFENSKRIINIEQATWKKKGSEVWQPTVLKADECTKMERYTAGLRIKNQM